ncbi:MAG: hypothetical protein WAL35_09565 [Acidimicrobiales bacterium]
MRGARTGVGRAGDGRVDPGRGDPAFAPGFAGARRAVLAGEEAVAFAVRLAPSTWGLALAEPTAFFPALTFFAAVISFAAVTFFAAETFLAAGAFFAAVAPFVTATFFPVDTLLATAAPRATTTLPAERDRTAFFAAAFFGDADAFFAPRARAAGGCPIRARAAGLVVRA